MTLEITQTLGRAVMVGIISSITVGPVAVLCIQRTLSKSRRSGVVSGLGVACADTLMALVAYFFYSMLQNQIELYDTLLRMVGGILVVGVGVYVFTQNPVTQIRKNRSGASSPWNDFASVFALTIANFIMIIPYILAFFAVFKIASSADTSSGFMAALNGLAVGVGFFAGSFGWWTMLAYIINLFRSKFKPRHTLTLNHIAGSLICSLGIYTILSTFITEYIKFNA